VHGGALPPLTIARGRKLSFVEVSVSVSAQRIKSPLPELVDAAQDHLFDILCNNEQVLNSVLFFYLTVSI